jgi:hypothetical protein
MVKNTDVVIPVNGVHIIVEETDEKGQTKIINNFSM